MILTPVSSIAVPARYRGVWRRTLLRTPTLCDTETIVYWLQTGHWHADIRIPAHRPDFNGVTTLAASSATQRNWLATQQGFAGNTEVTITPNSEICAWHRLVDFQPPAAGPDAGYMEFTPTHLIEAGVHGVYLEHWQKLPRSDSGFMVLQCLEDDTGVPAAPRLLLVAGDHVMHVRARAQSWPPGTPPGTRLGSAVDLQASPAMLDFEIAFGHRTADGWEIRHSTLPWCETMAVAVQMTALGLPTRRNDRVSAEPQVGDQVHLCWNGVPSRWQTLEYEAVDGRLAV